MTEYVRFDAARLTTAQREAAEALLGLQWNAVGVVVESVARYLEYLARDDEEVRLVPGDEAIEHVADQLRREAASDVPALRYFGLLEARLDFEGASSQGPFRALARDEAARPGDEVLVDGAWIRWVAGEVERHPAWDALRRRPWRRRRDDGE